jgi:hypothetical protein
MVNGVYPHLTGHTKEDPVHRHGEGGNEVDTHLTRHPRKPLSTDMVNELTL